MRQATKKPTRKPKDAASPLVGKFFHSYVEGKMEWQGLVLGALPGDRFLVQLFGWIDGYPTDQLIVRLDDMSAWKFYDDTDGWSVAYEKYMARHLARRDEERAREAERAKESGKVDPAK
jgi:hypothetical protein